MKLIKLLKENQTAMLNEWFERVIKTYPDETSKFLKQAKNAFENPIGHATFQSLEAVLKGLLEGHAAETFKAALDPIIRIRAVQSFTSSEAVAFVFDLKKIVRENLGSELQNSQILKELLVFDAKIDELALIAFDKFMECREKIYQIKATEEQKRTFSAFERAGLISGLPKELGPGL